MKERLTKLIKEAQERYIYAEEQAQYLIDNGVDCVKHGEWILEYGDYGKMICSVCKKTAPTERKPDPYEDFQMYKQAGNSIVVDVLEELFSMMLDEKGEINV